MSHHYADERRVYERQECQGRARAGMTVPKLIEQQIQRASLILGVDPGPSDSGYALVTPNYGCVEAGKITNHALLNCLGGSIRPSVVAIESIQSYGMAVGRSVFETCYQIGAILEVCRRLNIPTYLYPRQEYARAICGTVKVTDSILRQALLLRFGADGKGGPMHILKGASDKRSAFSVAVYHVDVTKRGGRLQGHRVMVSVSEVAEWKDG